MAGAKTYAFANAIINAYLRGGATPYMGLASAVADGDASSVTELSGGSYARALVTFAAPSAGQTSNSAQVNFPVATANWANATHALVFDASTGGTLLYYGPLDTAKQVTTGEQFFLPPGSVIVNEL
jgi:hypothetical protein